MSTLHDGSLDRPGASSVGVSVACSGDILMCCTTRQLVRGCVCARYQEHVVSVVPLKVGVEREGFVCQRFRFMPVPVNRDCPTRSVSVSAKQRSLSHSKVCRHALWEEQQYVSRLQCCNILHPTVLPASRQDPPLGALLTHTHTQGAPTTKVRTTLSTAQSTPLLPCTLRWTEYLASHIWSTWRSTPAPRLPK